MFEIPSIEDQPAKLEAAATPPALVSLAYQMANMGFFAREDLRVGTGGVRRLIEKAMERWWKERRLSTAPGPLPLIFRIVCPGEFRDMRFADPKDAYLVLDNHAAPARCYLQPLIQDYRLGKIRPELAEHALAVLYAGLNAVCYSVKAPELLAMARAYWWFGHDSEKGTPAADRRSRIMSRRMFDNRIAPITQNPRRWHHVYEHSKRSGLVTDLAAVESALRSRHLLRRNAAEISGLPPGLIAAFVRGRHGDPAFRLMDDHWHMLQEGHETVTGVTTADFHGAWPLSNTAEIEAALKGIPPTVRLIEALNALLRRMTYVAGRNVFGGY